MVDQVTDRSLLPEEPVASLDDYVAAGGGAGLRRALELDPAEVVEEVARSGLRGRGGAGFPTGVKWRSVLQAAGDELPLYVVCNAAEGEPGTYKDRVLMARNPFQLLEGLLIAMRALGPREAFIGIKERFTHEAERVMDARAAMAAAGWARADDVRVVLGPDEYLYGEEKAMLEVIEGKLPLPRILPPYMQGLFATMQSPNPTAVNNVETLSHVGHILARGADWFRQRGTAEAPGTMVFTVIGDVDSPGVYELPLGTPLRTLLEDIAGARDVKAVYSGTSNTVITPDLFDLPMDFDSFKEAGTGLGSGGFVVYSTQRCMVQVAATLARFLAVESCGQCLACKLGTGEIFERLDKLVRGEGTGADIEEIRKRTETVTDQNRCYLPVGAALLVRSTLDTFADEFAARVGSPSPAAVAVAVPKIDRIDEDTGEVVLDPDYERKRPDWSYAPAPSGETPER
ncbi:MAG TPA: NADH-ubiquinone oxidoreductase-F iron-sulfur binding region domain-containing protein [Egibacteraceae bacterium]|nr:SLBB domain-containing protein [Actinomycetota bacterium]HWB73263.1 NADH-ubiquinone oxidoreductase-F iron-sulfur binding region domain-containing protein [Egibacteraceae bacterium]